MLTLERVQERNDGRKPSSNEPLNMTLNQRAMRRDAQKRTAYMMLNETANILLRPVRACTRM